MTICDVKIKTDSKKAVSGATSESRPQMHKDCKYSFYCNRKKKEGETFVSPSCVDCNVAMHQRGDQ